MVTEYSSTWDILRATWGLLLPAGTTRFQFQDPLMSPVRPSGIKTHYLLFMNGSTIGGVVEAEDSVTFTAVPLGAYVKFLFPAALLADQRDGVALDDRRYWTSLIEAHQATKLRSLGEVLIGKSWGQVTTRDAQARR